LLPLLIAPLFQVDEPSSIETLTVSLINAWLEKGHGQF
jgi:hypothetical protein